MNDCSGGTAPHTCALCEQPLTEGEPWEYEKGAYPIGTPERAKHRVHAHCVAALVRETLELLAKVPEDQPDEITLDRSKGAGHDHG